MNALEGVFLWGAVGLYVLALLGALVSAIFHKPWAATVAAGAWSLALVLHLGAGIVRWIAAGHAPVQYAYENSLSGSFFVALVFSVLTLRFPVTRPGLPVVAAFVLLLLGNGLMAPTTAVPLEPPFRSAWLAVHVLFAWVAFGSYLVASATSGVYLFKGRAGRPVSGLLDDLSGRLLALGFAADTVMIASGAIWAHGLWGRYWGWDPIETWSLLSWLVYGANLHLRFTLGWQGRRAAWLAVASVLTVIVTFFGVGVVSGVHTELLR